MPPISLHVRVTFISSPGLDCQADKQADIYDRRRRKRSHPAQKLAPLTSVVALATTPNQPRTPTPSPSHRHRPHPSTRKHETKRPRPRPALLPSTTWQAGGAHACAMATPAQRGAPHRTAPSRARNSLPTSQCLPPCSRHITFGLSLGTSRPLSDTANT